MNNELDAFYQEIFNQLRDGVYFVDHHRKITFWNRAAERITGYSQSTEISHSCMENILMHVNDQGEVLCLGQCPLARTLRDGEHREARLYLHHADGHRAPVIVRVIPIYANDRIVGAAEIFTEELNLATAMARIEELEKEVLLDPLTQIANRRYIQMSLDTSLTGWRTLRSPFGILFIDIDHFKRVNDTYGHEIGDQVLKMVAGTLRNNLRLNDFVGRWGGEEFLVIAASASLNALVGLAERLRMLVEKSYLHGNEEIHVEKHNIHVTISIGGAIVEDEDTWESVLERADQRLYESKQQGRNPQAEVQEPGYKQNMADMNAVLALRQLPRLDEFIRRRDEISSLYRRELAGVDGVLPLADPAWPHRHARHLFVVRVDERKAGLDRAAFMEGLKARNIGTGIHFLASHTHRWYRENRPQWMGRLPDTEWNSARICTIPMFPDMTDDDVMDVVHAIKETLAGARTMVAGGIR